MSKRTLEESATTDAASSLLLASTDAASGLLLASTDAATAASTNVAKELPAGANAATMHKWKSDWFALQSRGTTVEQDLEERRPCEGLSVVFGGTLIVEEATNHTYYLSLEDARSIVKTAGGAAPAQISGKTTTVVLGETNREKGWDDGRKQQAISKMSKQKREETVVDFVDFANKYGLGAALLENHVHANYSDKKIPVGETRVRGQLMSYTLMYNQKAEGETNNCLVKGTAIHAGGLNAPFDDFC